MKIEIGDLVKVTNCDFGNSRYIGKLAMVMKVGTWSCDVRFFEDGRILRYKKEDVTKLGEQQ